MVTVDYEKEYIMSLEFNDFVQFVKSQPKGTPINHDEGWECCAVGDFIRHKNGEFDFAVSFEFVDTIPSDIRNILGNIGLYEDNTIDEHNLSTYGGLSIWLDEMLEAVV